MEFCAGTTVVEYAAGPVSVFDAYITGIERLRSPRHMICLNQQDSNSEDTWQGDRLPKKHWGAGSVGFMPANAFLRSLPDHPYQDTGIRFDHDLFAQAAAGHMDIDRLDLHFAEVTDPVTSSLSKALRALAMSGGFETWPLLVESTSLALAVALIKQLTPGAERAFAAVAGGLDPVRRRRVTDLIAASLHQRITIADLADAAALSVWHFSRQFQLSFGMPPARYVALRRIELAKLQLSGHSPLIDVAMACGFASQSHFGTAFKTITGMTPAEYRRTAHR